MISNVVLDTIASDTLAMFCIGARFFVSFAMLCFYKYSEVYEIL